MNAQPIDELLNLDRLTDLAQSAVSDAHDLWPRIERSVRDLQRGKAEFGAMRRNIVVVFGSLAAVGVLVVVLVTPGIMFFGGVDESEKAPGTSNDAMYSTDSEEAHPESTDASIGAGSASDNRAGEESTPPPEAAAPEIDDPPSDAELRDLQHIASEEGISLQEAIDRYAWNNRFSLAVAKIREASPEAFARAEIVDGDHAWVGFAGRAPEAALDIIGTFSRSHSGVSVEVRTDLGFTEVELERAIEAVHFAVLGAPEVRDASTSFDFEAGQIRTTVVLESTASDSVLDDLRAVAEKNLIDATRADILNSMTTSVVRSNREVIGGSD